MTLTNIPNENVKENTKTLNIYDFSEDSPVPELDKISNNPASVEIGLENKIIYNPRIEKDSFIF